MPTLVVTMISNGMHIKIPINAILSKNKVLVEYISTSQFKAKIYCYSSNDKSECHSQRNNPQHEKQHSYTRDSNLWPKCDWHLYKPQFITRHRCYSQDFVSGRDGARRARCTHVYRDIANVPKHVFGNNSLISPPIQTNKVCEMIRKPRRVEWCQRRKNLN